MISYSLKVFFTVIFALPLMAVQAQSVFDDNSTLAPGYGKLTYPLPAQGSYQLPPLGKALDGPILDELGDSETLHRLFSGKYVLLSFIYSNCGDVNGCPLTSNVNFKLKQAMQKDALLDDNLRLISLSFDPERDTPEVMRLYGDNFKYAGKNGEWRFVTTESLEKLTPILESYDQDIQRERSVNGDQSESISHLLRVFLIDPEFNIRNIYSVGFLHSDLIVNDVKTLILNARTNASKKGSVPSIISVLSKPGDNKDGYDTKKYTTRSSSLTEREGKGETTDLLAIAQNPPLGLPVLPPHVLKQLTKEKIALGRALYFDRRLSLNNTFSCAMCHVPEQGFTSNEISMAVGIEGRSVRRNTPTILNVAYAKRLFHDGRENSLEQQSWGPLLAKNEMGNPSVGYVVEKIKQISNYKESFKRAFNGDTVNMNTIGAALAAYQRTLISADSPFDRWFYGQQESALNKQERNGFKLFIGKGGCVSCHSVGSDDTLFSDNKMHNTGIGYNNSMGVKPATERIALAPGVFVDVDRSIIDSVSEPTPSDLGLYEITENPADRWKYKTPTLRNVSLTAPYMHDGSLSSLKDVVQFYNQGGIKNVVLDPLIKPLNLTEQDIDDLVAFLQALTGSNIDVLVADAFSAPVGDLAESEVNWFAKSFQE
ncbi:MAG: cytochrome c peroxidase [Polaribacter sp.]